MTLCIIILARRGKYKKYQKILKNYETSGHSLDTIMAQFFPSRKEILAAFIVPILYTFGHYIHKKPPLPLSKGGQFFHNMFITILSSVHNAEKEIKAHKQGHINKL